MFLWVEVDHFKYLNDLITSYSDVSHLRFYYANVDVLHFKSPDPNHILFEKRDTQNLCRRRENEMLWKDKKSSLRLDCYE